MNKKNKKIELKVKTVLPTKHGEFDLYLFEDSKDGKQHIALVKKGGEMLVRIHSECLTGDTFHSMRCDCGAQLDSALEIIGKRGGVLLYLRQEGRGIGLLNKLKAYVLQDEGMDTVEANEKLGFESDLRDYEVGAEILKELGIKKIKLMTNNPEKKSDLEERSITIIDCIPLQTKTNRYNKKYLQTKKEKMGHDLNI